MRSLQDKRIAFNFLFLSSPLQPSFMSPSQVKRRIIPDKMFLKKTRRPKTKLTNTPGKKNTGKKNTKKSPAQKHRASQIAKKTYYACKAVTATVSIISSTLQPRERSFKGLAKPWHTGPIAFQPPILAHIL